MADKMKLRQGERLLDVGSNRGVQSCFLAREYEVQVTAIDPWDDRMDGRPMVEHCRENADSWDVANSVLAVHAGVPETGFASESFDYVYSSTALEMLRVMDGEDVYRKALVEIMRVLRPGGIFGVAEPMHYDVDIPDDLLPFLSQEEFPWKECFKTLDETVATIENTGFSIVEADYVPDAWGWWMEFAKHDPFCIEDPDGDPKTLAVDDGRWTSFGYVIAEKSL